MRSIPPFAHWAAVRLVKTSIWRFKPSVVSVTGTVGKTTTKAAITAVLSPMRRVRIAPDGVPPYAALALTVLATDEHLAEAPSQYARGETHDFRRAWFWVRVLAFATWRLVRTRRKDAPDVCVAEYGKPEHVRQLLRLVRPTVAVLTVVGDVAPPGSRGEDDPLRDFARTVEQLPAAAFAVIPSDDIASAVRQRTRAHVLTYGMGDAAHVQVQSVLQEIGADGTPAVSADVSYGGSVVPVLLNGAVGPYQANAAAAAMCVGIIFGATLPDLASSLASYEPPEGSIHVMPAVKEAMLIEDTCDAHLLTTLAGLELLDAYPGKRKIVVLGDLVDLGSKSMEVHEYLGRVIKETGDVLIAVGSRARIAAESALRAKMNKKNVFAFARVEEAATALQELLKKGDVALVTGSRVMHLDRVIEEVRLQGAKDVAIAQEG